MVNHEAGSQMKLYVHLGSEPARAVAIFCRANNMEAQEIKVDILGQESRKPEFKKINPMAMIPCINDDGFQLYESHAILRYLAATRNVADHWYPQNAKKRALVDAALDWHHLNLRLYAGQLLDNRTLAKLPEFEGYFQAGDYDTLAADAEKRLPRVFDELEFMLQDGKYLQNADEVSIADLSLVCEMTQLQALCRVEDLQNLLGSHEKITKWMVAVEEALDPHFSDAHQEVRAFGKHIAEVRANGADI